MARASKANATWRWVLARTRAGLRRLAGKSPDAPLNSIGAFGEQAAADHLRTLGYTILARNARVPMGEADIIALEGSTYVIVEVKTRLRGAQAPHASNTTAPERSITLHKQRKLRQIAAYLRRQNRWTNVRIDVVGVEVERDEHDALRVLAVRVHTRAV